VTREEFDALEKGDYVQKDQQGMSALVAFVDEVRGRVFLSWYTNEGYRPYDVYTRGRPYTYVCAANWSIRKRRPKTRNRTAAAAKRVEYYNASKRLKARDAVVA